jgi:hypothetical protein
VPPKSRGPLCHISVLRKSGVHFAKYASVPAINYFTDFLVRFPELAFAAFFSAFVFGAMDLLAGVAAKCLLTFAAS